MYATSGAFFYDGDADDLSVLALNLEHGVVATTSVGRAPTTGHPNGYGGDRRMRVMGSHGTIVVDAGAPSLAVYGNGRAEQRYFGAESLRALVDHFVAAARGEPRPSWARATPAQRSKSSLPRANPPRPIASSTCRRTAHETRHLPDRGRHPPRRAAR